VDRELQAISIAETRFVVLAKPVAAVRLYLDHTWLRPEENLATDEALLHWCEARPGTEVLRLWESPSPFVVLGYGNSAAHEVDLDACAQLRIPVLRRCSGGGTVLQAPGCLCYALILQTALHPELRNVSSTNRWIMETHRSLLCSLTGRDVRVAGTTDLVIGGKKCSGNSQKRSRAHVLFHGTFLLRLDLALVTRTLRHPSREPGYRLGRPHVDFLQQLPVSGPTLRLALRECWRAESEFTAPLHTEIQNLLDQRYGQESWHRRRQVAASAYAAERCRRR
jgi:lipoate-protein ligase A